MPHLEVSAPDTESEDITAPRNIREEGLYYIYEGYTVGKT